MIVKIEIIAAPGCKKCAGAQGNLRAIAASLLGENNVDDPYIWGALRGAGSGLITSGASAPFDPAAFSGRWEDIAGYWGRTMLAGAASGAIGGANDVRNKGIKAKNQPAVSAPAPDPATAAPAPTVTAPAPAVTAPAPAVTAPPVVASPPVATAPAAPQRIFPDSPFQTDAEVFEHMSR